MPDEGPFIEIVTAFPMPGVVAPAARQDIVAGAPPFTMTFMLQLKSRFEPHAAAAAATATAIALLILFPLPRALFPRPPGTRYRALPRGKEIAVSPAIRVEMWSDLLHAR